MILVKRKEVWWVDFNNSIAGEVQKTRPVIIISNDYANEYSNRVQVILLTSKIEKCYPCETYVLVGDQKSKAMADQIMTVSKNRLKSKITTISDKDMRSIERVIKVQLSLHS
jgi:mRNA interferase MazF